MKTFQFHNSVVWQKAIHLAKETIILSRKLPKSEEMSLRLDLLNSAIAVSKNIAEGSFQKTKPEKKNFYVNARIALIELDILMDVSVHLKYLQANELKKHGPCFIELYKMISDLIDSGK